MTPQEGLVYVMVLVAAVDRELTIQEIDELRGEVRRLPIFEGLDDERLPALAADCARMLGGEDGLDRTLEAIGEAIPARLADTAYTLACDMAMADGRAGMEEIGILDLLAETLEVSRLSRAAIEHAARARHRRI